MKIRPGHNQVVAVLTPQEATRVASELVRCAIQSGGSVEDGERLKSIGEDVEEREG
jgi:hypothetical protein